MVLHVVRREGDAVDRIAVAAAHIESAIAHLNNAAQSAMASEGPGETSRVAELRLIVRALADIRESLGALRREQVAVS